MVIPLDALRPWNTHWATGAVSPLVLRSQHRRVAVPRLTAELLNPPHGQWRLLPGPRQIGKTTSLGHVASSLIHEHDVDPRRITIVPFDQPGIALDPRRGFEEVFETAMGLAPPTAERPIFLLFDEVQEVDHWARWLKAAWDRHHAYARVLATGSSAMHIIRPANADFPGRIVTRTMHPMKFREVLDAHPQRAEHASPAAWEKLDVRMRKARAAIAEGASARKVGHAFEALHEHVLSVPTLAPFLQSTFQEYVVWGGYPQARPGADVNPAERRAVFEQAWNAVLARDVPAVGVVKTREFTQLFQHIAVNPGGKFVPASLSRHLGPKAETLAQWKLVLEDALLVQQLTPLKPNLTPTNAKDKAYLLDPGWHAYFAGVVDTPDVLDKPILGQLVETVLADHARRLHFNVFGSTSLQVGYVEEPEIDIAANLGRRWLLLEAKYRARPQGKVNDVDGLPEDALRVVATRSHFEPPSGDGALLVPAHEWALVC